MSIKELLDTLGHKFNRKPRFLWLSLRLEAEMVEFPSPLLENALVFNQGGVFRIE